MPCTRVKLLEVEDSEVQVLEEGWGGVTARKEVHLKEQHHQ